MRTSIASILGASLFLTLSSSTFGWQASTYRPTLPPESASYTHSLAAGAPSPGLTFFQPMFHDTAVLVDETGTVRKTWPGLANPGLMSYVLPNGNVLRTGVLAVGPGGGAGGHIEEIDEDLNLLWQFDYATANVLHHHDVEPMPNGNVLFIAWDFLTTAEAIFEGRNPALVPGTRFSPDSVIEIEPDGLGGASIVWEWHATDHLIQDFDPAQDNFGNVAAHPELIDINFPATPTDDWLHFNSVDYNPDLDQILVSVNFLNEVWVIDHSTSTAEAAGHTGGNSGKGGDLLYRWGNPQAYRAGVPADQTLFRQHDAQWIAPGYPGAGNMLVFNNGPGRPAGNFSTVDEWAPPVDGSGNYTLSPGSAYGPATTVWSYQDPVPTNFFSNIISGTERLPNGNTLIINGVAGHLFEVNPAMQTVWQYQNPNGTPIWVFKARRYDYVCGTSPYCVGAPNSAGPGASIDSSGSTSLAANDLVLEASGAPSGVSGLFYYGEHPIQAPFGDGFRCAGGMTLRLNPPVAADASGNFTRPLDVNAPPANGGNGLLTIGSTWNFQLWYRDQAGPGGTGFNTSDALAVTFCD